MTTNNNKIRNSQGNEKMIPKIIFQTWKTHQVPEKWKSSPLSIKRYMPHWKHVLFSDEDNERFVEEHFPEYIEFYKKLRFPIQKADFIRYCFLYVYGGVYSDLDIEFTSPIDHLFKIENEHDLVYLLKAPQNFAGHFTNFFMASSPKNSFWLLVLRECVEHLPAWVILPHHIISEQTGLACLSRAARKILSENRLDTRIVELPFNNLVPCDICSYSSEKKPFYYTKFLKGQSWNGFDTLLFNFFICNTLEVFLGLVVLFVVAKYRKIIL